jgi:hypothetical protein
MDPNVGCKKYDKNCHAFKILIEVKEGRREGGKELKSNNLQDKRKTLL